MAKIQLCLLDCSSIQKYVFGSNKLKANIGASFIVEQIYKQWLPETLKELGYKDVDDRFKCWATSTIIELIKNPSLGWEMGYVGGGNALILFCDNQAEKFINRWNRNLLLHAPELKPVVATHEIDIDGNEKDIGKTDIDKLFRQLDRNKSRVIPNTHIMPHGITAECPISGLSADIKKLVQDEDRWISSVIATKLNYSEQAKEALNDEYSEVLEGKFEFSDDLENLGQAKSVANHIAIVHIDGNNLGRVFKNCKGLIERRKLSIEVKKAIKTAMVLTLLELIGTIDCLNEHVLSWDEKKKSEKDLLPVRPIILNGDDITLICDARVSFFLAETFMQKFEQQTGALNKELDQEEKIVLSSCAGIAIIKTKFPFYRGYMLAEQLCARAKEEGRKDNTSWLDFHIAYRGLSESLKEMRIKNYQIGEDSLSWRPWKISSENTKDSFHQLKNAIKIIRDAEATKWPRSKLNELARALVQGKVATSEYLKLASARGLYLSVIAQPIQDGNKDTTGWHLKTQQDNKVITATPYFDVLEVMDFYHECLLA